MDPVWIMNGDTSNVDTKISAYEKPIARMHAIYEPIALEDGLPQAGRKLFALHFGSFLSHLERLEDEPALHVLSQAGRRAMRSALIFPIFEEDKRSQAALTTLRKVVAAAQSVTLFRQLLLHPTLNDMPQADGEALSPLQSVRLRVQSRAAKAEKQLASLLESDEFSQSVKRLTKAVKNGNGDPALSLSEYEVRHGAPILLHNALADVRSYDNAVAEGNLATLSRLYKALLRLDDTIGFFQPLLGASIENFTTRYQPLVETLHPVYRDQFVQHALNASKKMEDAAKDALHNFLASLHHEAEESAAGFPDQWASFNTRSAQRKFSDALLVLR